MKDHEAHKRLVAFVANYPSQKAAAAALHISSPYLGDLLKGARPLSDRILNEIGLARVIIEKRSA